MNERIRELAEQAKLRPALILKHWGTIDALTDSEQEELSQLEQFAELILRECIDTISDCSIDYCTRPQIVSEIKEHFGVKR